MKQFMPLGRLTLVMSAGFSAAVLAATQAKPEDTEVWQPEPPVVSAPANAAPSDAIVLFDGKNLAAWESVNGGAAPWTIQDGVVTVKPDAGGIRTKQDFCDIQLHLEWRVPQPEAGMEGQGRNNSGVFLQSRYEIQVLDSYNNRTYSNGQAASLYKQAIPQVNAMRPPGEWQSYDIIYNAPRFDEDALMTPGFVTVLHNGVLVQNHVAFQGSTEYIGPASYKPHGCAPLMLQDHHNQVSFRNIWVREIK